MRLLKFLNESRVFHMPEFSSYRLLHEGGLSDGLQLSNRCVLSEEDKKFVVCHIPPLDGAALAWLLSHAEQSEEAVYTGSEGGHQSWKKVCQVLIRRGHNFTDPDLIPDSELRQKVLDVLGLATS